MSESGGYFCKLLNKTGEEFFISIQAQSKEAIYEVIVLAFRPNQIPLSNHY